MSPEKTLVFGLGFVCILAVTITLGILGYNNYFIKAGYTQITVPGIDGYIWVLPESETQEKLKICQEDLSYLEAFIDSQSAGPIEEKE